MKKCSALEEELSKIMDNISVIGSSPPDLTERGLSRIVHIALASALPEVNFLVCFTLNNADYEIFYFNQK